LVLEEAQSEVGVADIDGQKHFYLIIIF